MNNQDSLDHANVAFRPPIMLLLLLVIGFILRIVFALPFLPKNISSILGPVTVISSFALFFYAVFTMRKNGESIPTNKPTVSIVSEGPYRYSRNPIYLSMICLIIGVGIWTNSLWFVLLAVINVFLLSQFVITQEEEYLRRKFGEVYLSYKSRVRRWI